MKDELYSNDFSLYAIENEIDFFGNLQSKICFMIDFEKIDHEKLFKNIHKFKKFVLRVAFKQNNYKSALDFCEKLSILGCNISLNPMHTSSYNDDELKYLVHKVNTITPSSLVVVDTNGQMIQDDVVKFANFFDKNIHPSVALGFHSHNNLNLSFDNALAFINFCSDRDIVLDSSLYGMGRGAGNLKIEEISSFLNEKYNKKYDVESLKKIIDELILPIYEKNPWDIKMQYVLAAKNRCHPNYAAFLIKNKYDDFDFCEYILKNIPIEAKNKFDEKLILSLLNYSKCSL